MSNYINDLVLANQSAALWHKLSHASKIWRTRREMPKLNWRGLPIIINGYSNRDLAIMLFITLIKG